MEDLFTGVSHFIRTIILFDFLVQIETMHENEMDASLRSLVVSERIRADFEQSSALLNQNIFRNWLNSTSVVEPEPGPEPEPEIGHGNSINAINISILMGIATVLKFILS